MEKHIEKIKALRKPMLGAVKYKFWLHDGTLLYSCKTDEKKNKYENGLKAKRVKYKIVVAEDLD